MGLECNTKFEHMQDRMMTPSFYDVDAVIIAAPTTLHYELAKTAMLAGKHCLIEKPVTVEIQQAEELKKIAEEKKLVVVIGHVERYNPVYPELKKENYFHTIRLKGE